MKPTMLASLVASMLAVNGVGCAAVSESPDAVVKCEGANDCKGQGACGGVNADGGLHGCEGKTLARARVGSKFPMLTVRNGAANQFVDSLD
jgi:hypothetical protein